VTSLATHLWEFHGGLHLEGHKDLSNATPIRQAPLPDQLVIPVRQHIGEPARPVVKVGDHVLKGQVIARPEGYVSAPVHASSSGRVVAIEERPVPHPSGLGDLCVVIEVDGKDQAVDATHADLDSLSPSDIRNRLREAGLVGLGGAAFPSAVKLNAGPAKPIDLLVLNGAECEPFITCDDRLMRERPEDIVRGARIMMAAAQAGKCAIAVEDNKPEAAEALKAAIGEAGVDDIEVVVIPTLYPTGAEKQLIFVLTGREVPSTGLPADIGVVCQNVGTAAAASRALEAGEPITSRVVTVTGSGVREPGNWEVRIGTPIEALIRAAGGYAEDTSRLVMGGPMNGFTLHTDRAPVVKATNCLLTMQEADVTKPVDPLPCIRCGACEEVCPANLLPQQLYWHTQGREFEKVQDYKLFDCIECGCCDMVCPSHIPLVQYFRFAKSEIWSQEEERKKADIARARHEFRQERLEREKREREARLAKKRAAMKNKASQPDDKKAAIQAARERAKARKQAAQTNNETEGGKPGSGQAPASDDS